MLLRWQRGGWEGDEAGQEWWRRSWVRETGDVRKHGGWQFAWQSQKGGNGGYRRGTGGGNLGVFEGVDEELAVKSALEGLEKDIWGDSWMKNGVFWSTAADGHASAASNGAKLYFNMWRIRCWVWICTGVPVAPGMDLRNFAQIW